MEETGFSEKKLLMKEKYVRKSYGTIVQTSSRGLLTPPITYIRHDLQPDETLQGISLKYGVTTEQIRRANRLLMTDSIFMRSYLLVPLAEEDAEVLKRSPVVRSQSLQSDIASSGSSRSTEPITDPITDPDEENRRDIENFLSKVDTSIANTKRNLAETRKKSGFLTGHLDTVDEPDTSADAAAAAASRLTYEGAYQSLNRSALNNSQHPDQRRRIRNSLHRLEQQQDELFEL